MPCSPDLGGQGGRALLILVLKGGGRIADSAYWDSCSVLHHAAIDQLHDDIVAAVGLHQHSHGGLLKN